MDNNNNQSSQAPEKLLQPPHDISLPPPSHHWIKQILILVVIILIATIGTILFQTYQANQQSEEVPIPKATIREVSPTTVMNETAGWKTYTNTSLGVTLKYSPFYTPTEKFVPLKGGEPTFIVSGNFNFDTDKISLCNTDTYQEKPCLSPGKNHYQEEDIQPIKLDGKNAVSFFVTFQNLDGGSDVLHVVQTAENPFVEIAISIAGMGGEENFQKILSTFRLIFSNPTPTVIIINDTYYCKDGSIVESSDKCSPLE